MKFPKLKSVCRITAILAALAVAFPALAEEKKPSGATVAVVNGVGIPRHDYDRELDMQVERFSRQGRQISDVQLARLKDDVLQSLIEREVLYQESQKAGINISDQAVNDQLAAIKQRFPDENEFKNILQKMNLTEDDVKSQIKHGLAIKELIDQQVVRNIVITEAETKSYYDANPEMFRQPEQVKASHILIKVDANATEAQKADAMLKIKDVQQKQKAGEDFAELAKKYSEGPSNVRGGDLGYFRRGQMVKPFEDAAFAMKPNEVSEVVETRFGYHLIKVYDKKPEMVLTYAEVKDTLSERLKEQKVEEQAGQYIEKLKTAAKIEKNL